MSSNIPLPPPPPQPIQDFYNSGLKGKTWQATPLFDCYLGAIPWPKFCYNFSVKKKQPLMKLTTPSFTSQKLVSLLLTNRRCSQLGGRELENVMNQEFGALQ